MGYFMISILRSAISNSEFSVWVVVSYLISAFVVIFIGSPIHEFAHAVTAVKLGDPTAKYMGRTSLNPLAHIDWLGALMILLFGFGYAKPVPVNANNFKKPKRDMAITALAGPVSNIIMGFIFYVIGTLLTKLTFKGLGGSDFLEVLILICGYIIQINVSLAVFNLIPIPPLDGSHLLKAALNDRHYFKLMQYERFFVFGLIILVFTGALDMPLMYLRNAVFSLYKLLTFWI